MSASAAINERSDHRRDGKYAENEGERSVPELNVLVPLLGLALNGNEGTSGAARPRRTSQARTRYANDGTGYDDPHLCDEIRDEDSPCQT
jgi:hypothetical protein